MIAIEITLQRDTATPAVQRVIDGLTPARLNPIVGRSATNTIRTHLFGLNTARPNWLGGPRTNYYAGAARATQFQLVADGVVVSINQVGMRLRYYGGTVRPKVAKFLTIPVHPKAHGKRAREFDLELVFGRGGEPIALATKSSVVTIVRQTKGGRITRKLGGRRGEIMFRLVRSVTQQADPSVLPTPETLQANVQRDVTSYVDRLIARRAGAPDAS